jgi:hypothetical protein
MPIKKILETATEVKKFLGEGEDANGEKAVKLGKSSYVSISMLALCVGVVVWGFTDRQQIIKFQTDLEKTIITEINTGFNSVNEKINTIQGELSIQRLRQQGSWTTEMQSAYSNQLRLYLTCTKENPNPYPDPHVIRRLYENK